MLFHITYVCVLLCVYICIIYLYINECVCVSLLHYIYIYIYNVITPHRSVFLSLSLTLKCCLHFFFPVQRRYSSSRQTRFFGNQPQRTACIPPVAAVSTTSVLAIQYANIMETHWSAGA